MDCEGKFDIEYFPLVKKECKQHPSSQKYTQNFQGYRKALKDYSEQYCSTAQQKFLDGL